MTTYDGQLNGSNRRIALVCSRFNDLIVSRLEYGARDALRRHGVDDDTIDTAWVPGALEIPIVAKALADSHRYDAIIGLGAVMRGATYHFEVVANNSASGLAQIGLDTGVVVTNGILTVDTMEQALERAGSKAGNKGADAALAALETLDVLERLKQDSPGG
jgi:6,7-dimethyl-8-ribityllumazine synthase